MYHMAITHAHTIICITTQKQEDPALQDPTCGVLVTVNGKRVLAAEGTMMSTNVYAEKAVPKGHVSLLAFRPIDRVCARSGVLRNV